MSVYVLPLPCNQKDSLFYVVTEPEFNELPYEYQRRFKKYSNVSSKANKGPDSKRYRKSDGLGKLPLKKKNQKDFDSELNEFVTGVPGVTFDNTGNFFYKGVYVGNSRVPKEVVEANVKKEQKKPFTTALNVSKAIGKLRPKRVPFRNPLNIEQISRKYYPGYYTMQYSVAEWYAKNYFKNGVVIKYALLERQNYVKITDLTNFNDIIGRLTLKAEVAGEAARAEIDDLIKKLEFMYQYNMTSDEQQKIKIRECRLHDIELHKQKGAPKASRRDAEPILKNRCSIPNIDFVVMKELCSMIEDDIFIFDEVPTFYGTYGPKFHPEVVICRPEILSDQGEVRDGSDVVIPLLSRGTFEAGTVFYKAFPPDLPEEYRQLWLIENASTEEGKKKATEDLMTMFDKQAEEFEMQLPSSSAEAP